MARLIDADALELFIASVRKRLYLDHTLSDIPTRDSMLLNFEQYVHLQPTIDRIHQEIVGGRIGRSKGTTDELATI